ncbi:MAG: hypothetical protein E6I91_11905 [Chloroflexi bacterium]|nr:MAG: hypothetical protein E6I91_11905 [Chloroflexota bacterium]
MNCIKCKAPLEANARFCPNCGEPVSSIIPNSIPAHPAPSYQPAFMAEPPPFPLDKQKNEPLVLRPGNQQASQPQAYGPTQYQLQPQAAPPQQSPYYQPGGNSLASSGSTKTRRRGRGCLVGLTIILLLLLVLVGGWFLLLRPYLNNQAQNKLDSVLSDAVSHIPPEVAVAPAGPVKVTENVFNNLLVLNSSPNDVVKNMQIHITPNTMSMQFQVYGFGNTVTGVPQVKQGHFVITNVTVDGVAGLILSADEITALVNRHLADAQARINHSIVSVQLNNQEMDLVLGASTSSPTPTGGPGGLPLPTGTPTIPLP